MLTLTGALFGIASSLIAEAVSWINNKLYDTPFKGQAALFISIGTAFVAGVVKTVWFDKLSLVDFQAVLNASIIAFGWSQLYFTTVAAWFGLQVKG